MAKPNGIEHFSDFFRAHQKDYVIIGGSAASILLEDEGLGFRKTVDLDVVLLTNASSGFNAKISEYLKLGSYQSKEETGEMPKYYRFSNPRDPVFPEMIEIFAKNESKIELNEGQNIIPIQNDEMAKISAILLDDEYFELLKANAIQSKEGFSILNNFSNICIKARAFREISERGGEEKKSNKHRNDIVRLTQTFKPSAVFTIGGVPLKDLLFVISDIENKLQDRDVKNILRNGVLKHKDIVETLKKGFGLM